MTKKKFITCLFLSCLMAANSILALEIRSVKTMDSLKISRTKFSSSEKITLFAEVYNSVSVSRINFTFVINGPTGSQLFKHTGNSIPGSIGAGGSEVGNIPVSKFYKSPGNYSLTVTATDGTGASVSKSSSFEIYSPIIVLSYPANGARDLVDQPLTFRWIGSGASKYKIYVDDDISFYNTLFTKETFDTSYSYPINPTDQRQKLIGGQIYYWKIDGLDAYGNKVAETSTPFSFSLKESGSSSSTRDLSIVSIKLGDKAVPPQVNIDVELKNAGGRAESDVTLTLYISGMLYGTQKVDLINAGETKTIAFTVEPPELSEDKSLFVSVNHSLYDDNAQNNILTVSLKLPAGYLQDKFAKILGKITEKDAKGKSKGIENARISYSGTKTGEVISGPGGQYKIEELVVGNYELEVNHPEYVPSKKTVAVEKGKAYPNIDFELSKRKSPVYTLEDIWLIIKDSLSKEILDELEGYQLKQVRGMNKDEFMDLINQIKEKQAKIINATISY